MKKCLATCTKYLWCTIIGFWLTTTVHSDPAASEETRYIRDILYVPLRSGQGSEYRVTHRGLPSGAMVHVIETSTDDQYSLVRVPNGVEGWLQTQYLMAEPAARDQLVLLNEKLTQLQKINRQLTEQLRQESHSEPMELVYTLEEANKMLLNDNQILQNDIQQLAVANQQLLHDKTQRAFLNGVFAVFIGAIIALAIARLWPRKKNGWS